LWALLKPKTIWQGQKEEPKLLIFSSNCFYSGDVWGRKVGVVGIFKWLFPPSPGPPCGQ
jgi:hypothetical protein